MAILAPYYHIHFFVTAETSLVVGSFQAWFIQMIEMDIFLDCVHIFDTESFNRMAVYTGW